MVKNRKNILDMNRRKSVITAWLLLTVLTASSQGVSAPYQPGITQDAVSYWLPKTKLTVIVTTRKNSFKPGEFSRYAERYLRMNDVKDKAEESWEITGIEITSYGIPDKNNLYTLSFPTNGTRPFIELTKEGIISAVNTHPKDDSNTSVPPAPAKNTTNRINPQTYMTEEIIMAGSTAKMAELTAKEIYSIRESRNSITRGQADYIPTDGESVKYMLESLSTQENALLTLFSGTSETEERLFTIDVTPDIPLTKQLLFRFSSKLGVLPNDNLAGEPVWIDITDNNLLEPPVEIESDKKNKNTNKKANAFLYCRIPGRATIKVYNNRVSFIEKEMPIAQFGNIEVVSSGIMGKNADTRITFDTATGAVLTINE